MSCAWDWKARGWAKPGRKRKFDHDKIRKLLSRGLLLRQVAEECDCSIVTVWNVKHGKYHIDLV